MANGNFGGGDGTKANPYLVEDVDDLLAVSSYMSSHFKQTRDINLSGRIWTPLASSNVAYPNDYFSGTFDGDNYKISNLKILSFSLRNYIYHEGANDHDWTSVQAYAGLFYRVIDGALLNIHLENVDMELTCNDYNTAFFYIGALAGEAIGRSRINNCSAKGVNLTLNMEGTQVTADIGGLIGASSRYSLSYTYFDKCYTEDVHIFTTCMATKVNYDTTLMSEVSVGGLVGQCSSILRNCYAQCFLNTIADTNTYSNIRAAGLVGYGVPDLTNCYAVVKTLSVGKSVYENGLCMMGNSTIDSCYYDATVSNIHHVDYSRTTTQMKQRETFVDWDFDTIWGIKENETYPYFIKVIKVKMKSTPFPLNFRKMKLIE